MRSRSLSGSRLSLTRQLLLFQLTLLGIVLVAVTATTLEQTSSIFASGQQRRMLTVAEYSAAIPTLRSALDNELAPELLASLAESLRTSTDVDHLIVTDADGLVLASPASPELVGEANLIGATPSSFGGAWAGVARIAEVPHIVASVPVFSTGSELVGRVIAGRESLTIGALLADAAPNLLTYLGVAGTLGVVGSWWIAARVKRQTLGLEPDQIARLVEHREALLHGIREGVIGVDSDGVITLATDSARNLLSLPDDAEGLSIDEVGLDEEAVRVLRSHGPNDRDVALVNRGALLVLNQATIRPPRSKSEVVTTLRDRTELVTLQNELGKSLLATDTLRAQTHEFTNRLHTISTLIQLGDTAEVVTYIDAVYRDTTVFDSTILTRIAEPAVAALLGAKSSLAREYGAKFTLTAESRLPRVDASMSTDLVTVIGILVDNALEAVKGATTRSVEVDVRPVNEDGTSQLSEVRVAVRDSGPGVDATVADHMFEPGVTTKSSARNEADNGYGLAIVKLIVTRRNGRVSYQTERGAVFEAILPSAHPEESVLA